MSDPDCETCNKGKGTVVKDTVAQLSDLPGADFTSRQPARATVRTHNGKTFGIDQVLVRVTPPMGYGVSIRLKDANHVIHADHPTDVYMKVRKFYADNDIEISDQTIWYNLNLIWTASVGEKHSIVRHKDLRALAKPVSELTEELDKAYARTITNRGVGSKGWAFAQLYLSINSDEYEPKVFRAITKILLKILATSDVGCPECHNNFKDELKNLDDSSRDTAREWVFDTMNKINVSQGKKPLSKAVAYTANKWDV